MRNFLKNNKGGASSILVGLFIAVLIGVVMLSVVNGVVDPATNPQLVTNQTWNTSTGDVYVSLGNTSIVNTSEYVGNSTYTAERYTDYLINNTDGTILSIDGAGLMNHTIYNISYRYLASSYISSSTTRTMVSILPLVFAVIIFVAIAAAAIKVSD